MPISLADELKAIEETDSEYEVQKLIARQLAIANHQAYIGNLIAMLSVDYRVLRWVKTVGDIAQLLEEEY